MGNGSKDDVRIRLQDSPVYNVYICLHSFKTKIELAIYIYNLIG